MSKDDLEVGDVVVESPLGPGTITGFSERGFPMVERVTVAWLRREDGALFDPYHVSEKQP